MQAGGRELKIAVDAVPTCGDMLVACDVGNVLSVCADAQAESRAAQHT